MGDQIYIKFYPNINYKLSCNASSNKTGPMQQYKESFAYGFIYLFFFSNFC